MSTLKLLLLLLPCRLLHSRKHEYGSSSKGKLAFGSNVMGGRQHKRVRSFQEVSADAADDDLKQVSQLSSNLAI